jgi:DNA invertase Pin-like site-specific DNA recombinase
MAPQRKAIGVVRVSRVGGREGESFVSPSEQRERIAQACKREGLKLVDTLEELDVSGGAPLAKRPGLSRAVELIEAGKADTLVVAYFDRLVRSLTVQADVVSRVEDVGGAILAVDVGRVTNGTSAQWLSATMLGAVSEYTRRMIAERTADAKRAAVERGEPPFAAVPPGYRLDKKRRIHPSKDAALVREAFKMRADGVSLRQVHRYLLQHGVKRSFHATQKMLGSRFYLGELRFGKLVNPNSHEAIIDADLWHRVQQTRSTRGRRGKSDRLLARLGVLRCASCGSRMVVSQYGKGQHVYRCSPTGQCEQRMTISALIAERAVEDALKEHLAGIKGRARGDQGLAAAQNEVERIEKQLDAAVLAFDGLDDVEAVREKLAGLRDKRDRARATLADLQANVVPALTITIEDWDDLTPEEQRALIRATLERVDVSPGRGAERLTFTYRS